MKEINMTNDIKLELTSEELKGMLEEYYSKVLNKNVSLKIHAEKRVEEYWGDGVSINMTFVVKERIGSKDVDITYTIEQKDIEEVMNELLREKGYEVGRIDYKVIRQNGSYLLTNATINLIERRKNLNLIKQYYEGDK